jgi:hypothetical protein
VGWAVGSAVGATVGRSVGVYVGRAVGRAVGSSVDVSVGVLIVSSSVAATTFTTKIIETHPAIMIYFLLRELLPVASVATSSSFLADKAWTLSVTAILRNL